VFGCSKANPSWLKFSLAPGRFYFEEGIISRAERGPAVGTLLIDNLQKPTRPPNFQRQDRDGRQNRRDEAGLTLQLDNWKKRMT
jgi:hypothetical protein